MRRRVELENWIIRRTETILRGLELKVKDTDLVLIQQLLEIAQSIAPILYREGGGILGSKITYHIVSRRQKSVREDMNVPPEEELMAFSDWCLDQEGKMYSAGRRVRLIDKIMDGIQEQRERLADRIRNFLKPD